ncbi:MAG: cytochrome c [Myxococcales bacterium]|nr:cytochrome c [Myxococcales bacterium]MCB9670934.1 cytochrome c [Alphaproteobacteria bacterium]
MTRYVVPFVLIACHNVNPRANTIAELEGDALAGQLTYEVACQECHGEDGRGTDRSLHGNKPVDFTTAAHYYRAPVFITFILDGVDGTDMEPWGQLQDQEIADVYAHILALPVE